MNKIKFNQWSCFELMFFSIFTKQRYGIYSRKTEIRSHSLPAKTKLSQTTCNFRQSILLILDILALKHAPRIEFFKAIKATIWSHLMEKSTPAKLRKQQNIQVISLFILFQFK